MAGEVRIVVIDGIRYREEDAPKSRQVEGDEPKPAETKMRQPRTAKNK